MVVEVMGRHAGWIALYSGRRRRGRRDSDPGAAVRHRGGLQPDPAPPLPRALLLDRRGGGGRAAAGGDARGRRRGRSTSSATSASAASASCSRARSRSAPAIETRAVVLGHIQRGGTPTAYDRVLATRFGVGAIDAAHDGALGDDAGAARDVDRARAARRCGRRAAHGDAGGVRLCRGVPGLAAARRGGLPSPRSPAAAAAPTRPPTPSCDVYVSLPDTERRPRRCRRCPARAGRRAERRGRRDHGRGDIPGRRPAHGGRPRRSGRTRARQRRTRRRSPTSATSIRARRARRCRSRIRAGMLQVSPASGADRSRRRLPRLRSDLGAPDHAASGPSAA